MDPAAPPPPPRRRRRLVELALVLVVVFGLQAFQSRSVARGPLPPLAAAGLDGRPLSLAALGGRPALLHFWATWCGVCRLEEGTIARLGRTTPLLTVATSSGEAAEVRAHLAANGLDWPVILDPDGAIAARFGVRAFPTTLVLDAKGEASSVTVGYTTELGLRARLLLAR